jgi:beta-galactosidase
VVGHDGTAETRVFRSVQKTGQILREIDEIAGTHTDAKAAVIFDWDNMWALDDCQGYANAGKKYFETCYAYHRQFWKRGIDCDIISPKADLSGYKIVVAPMLYLADDAVIDNLGSFVKNGGLLYGTYMLGTVDENDLCRLGGIPGGKLKEIFGLVSEEIDVLYPVESQKAEIDGKYYDIIDYAEVLRPISAKALANYADEWYAGSPAVTVNHYGKGKAVYQACRDRGDLASHIFDTILSEIDLRGHLGAASLPHGVTAHSRTDGEHTYLFVENYSREEVSLPLPRPMENMLTGTKEETATLTGYGFQIYRSM